MRSQGIPRYIPKVGDLVDYHSIIGGPVTKPGLTVTHEPYYLGGPKGALVCFVDGVSGCVAVKALTPAVEVPQC